MVTRVVAEVFPYDRVHDVYQEYYRNALESRLTRNGGEFNVSSAAYSEALLRVLRRIRHSYRLRRLFRGELAPRFIDKAARLLSRGPVMSPTPNHPVGVYRFTTDQHRMLRVCIDSNDFPGIAEETAATSDIYFKTNFWPSRAYPPHVRPLPNMNPLVARNLDLFRKLRRAPKEWDLFAFFRVWGGRDEVEGIEHNMALLEALSKTKCKSYILAYLVAGDVPSLGKRLDDLGITWTTKPMPALELWEMAARAKLNVVRMGMHQCSPWRMIDILAMGGVPVVDYKPMTVWPEPLVEGVHYLDLAFPPGQFDRAREIPGRIDSWLQRESLPTSLSRNTADYFDRFLEPEMLGEYIQRSVEDFAWPIL